MARENTDATGATTYPSGLLGSQGAEILDAEPGEAKMLIGLIETLIVDWYVGREERRKRLKEIRQITGEGEIVKDADSQQ